jgi:YaiO family outer membrane protein
MPTAASVTRTRRATTAARVAPARAMTAAALVAVALLAALAPRLRAQPPLGIFPGAWVEAGVTAQRVTTPSGTDDLGDWRGAWARAVLPAGARDTWWADAFALEAFGTRGVQLGVAHRHDWTGRFFHLAGATVADGAPIFARVRADLQLGARLGPARTVVATAGISHVRSVQDLTDAALLANLAWYAPRGLVLEAGVRANTSWPGRIRTARITGAVTRLGPRRSLSLRAIGGEEGWQVLTTETALVRFASREASLAWRERLGGRWSSAVQVDWYDNPTYTRAGASVGLALGW